ncbi:Cgr1p ASCRUDRAFT_109007 [Ascoidea rubescens DSM 1968]|uniref:rRNA-processing protein n=1 Tax=Ascoidea rubescens DSM 1968 TaxID=1344418 RepID=A0A1D2VEN3_9ASCO|nr:hypothetical protein ASCRUDRAFT_109007 [Ascoidea rubescens DSM 1968]ODV59980.1 hypothetical protein ASCRUDRAFT_109007 [Ascoidea rubescens DSM 1968]
MSESAILKTESILPQGPRVSGKEWKLKKDPFRINKPDTTTKNVNSSFQKRLNQRNLKKQYDLKLKELKDESKLKKDLVIQKKKEKNLRLMEIERASKLSKKLNEKRLKRLQKKQKRNKLLNDR